MNDSLLDAYSPSDEQWLVVVDGSDPRYEPAVEGLLSLVNGYLGTRAAAEDGGVVSRPATLLAGVFDTPALPQTPELEEAIPELVVAPDWSCVRILVEGQDIRSGAAEMFSQTRMLDLRQGVLRRDWSIRDAAGRVTSLSSLRFASLADRHLLVQVLRIRPENYSGHITLLGIVDGDVTNQNQTRHLELLDRRELADGSLMVLGTLQSRVVMAWAMRTSVVDGSDGEIPGQAVEDGPQLVRRWEWEAERGRSYELYRVVSTYTSRDAAEPERAAAAKIAGLGADSVPALLAAHRSAWSDRWATSDVEIAGSAELQHGARAAIYHLIGAANPDDDRASVGARSLTGERYRGHVFWDTEIFVWPFYLYTHPETARALLMYRYHTLDAARRKAAALGYRGALYAWESADTGDETTPPYVRSPRGDRVPVLTGVQEHHISADIAYAVWQYRKVTGDEAFFLDYGAEILFEVARFWASRSTPGSDGRYHILQVIGPDEYHSSVDDNAFTNVLARWVLRRALEVATELQHERPDRWRMLAGRLGLTAAELEAWRLVADGLVDGFDPQTGLFEQFRGYFDLRDVDLAGHDPASATMDAKLDGGELWNTKVSKQADVVMLVFLLWDEFAPEVREANYRYYAPRCSHDSSLSAGMHSLVAARLGDLDAAERLLRQAVRIDLDISHTGLAGASEGVHIASAGGIWQALVLGFLGLRVADQGMILDPHVPAGWGALSAALQWRGRRLRVAATAGEAGVEVTVESGEPLSLAVGDGAWHMVSPGGSTKVP